MWSTGGELTNLFREPRDRHRYGLAADDTASCEKARFPIGETIPKENTTGWIDHLMITAGSENKELAKNSWNT